MTAEQVSRRSHTVLASADSQVFTSLRHSAPPRAERYALGRRLRQNVPRSSLGEWAPAPGRPDVVAQVIRPHAGRQERLVPVRTGRS